MNSSRDGLVCPVCEGELSGAIPYPGRATAAATPLRLQSIAICRRCGAGTAMPRPDQPALDQFYASGEYWHSSSGGMQRAHEFSQAWLRVASVRRAVALGDRLTVADVGAGHGGIPRALASLGVPVASYLFVEPDDGAARQISAARLPFEIRRARSIQELGGPVDLLFLNHVLEHVADPLRFLEIGIERVREGGAAYVETPNADHRFKADVFPHLFFFTPEALRCLGERVGVRTIACEPFGRLPAPRTTPLGLVQRVAARGLAAAARFDVPRAQRLLDRVLWRYAPAPAGIWLRWIFRVDRAQLRQTSGTKAR